MAMSGTMGEVSAMLVTAMDAQSTLSNEMKFITATGAVHVFSLTHRNPM